MDQPTFMKWCKVYMALGGTEIDTAACDHITQQALKLAGPLAGLCNFPSCIRLD